MLIGGSGCCMLYATGPPAPTCFQKRLGGAEGLKCFPGCAVSGKSWSEMRHCYLLTNHNYSYFNDGQFTSTGNEMMPGMLTRQNGLVSGI